MMKKILLVEDETYIRELFQMYLKEAGYDVTAAKSGNEAIDRFKEADFDLVLLDIILPEKDGITALEEMSKLGKKVPVLMLTNLAHENLVNKAFEFGASGYLLKARVDKEDLLKEISNFLTASANSGEQPSAPPKVF